jgi:hypothetical protein
MLLLLKIGNSHGNDCEYYSPAFSADGPAFHCDYYIGIAVSQELAASFSRITSDWVSFCDTIEYFSFEVRFCLARMNGTFVLENRLDCPLFAISLCL